MIFLISFTIRLITAIIYLNFDAHFLSLGNQPFFPLAEKFNNVAGVVGDRDGYNTLAHNILTTGSLGKAEYRKPSLPPPLYPIFLAICYSVFGYNIFAFFIPHIVLDSVNGILIFFLAQRLFNHKSISITAGLFYVFNPHFVLSSIQLYSETLYFFLVLSLFLFCQKFLLEHKKKYAVGIGILAALSALCRSVFLVFVPFIFLWLIIVFYKQWRRIWFHIFIIFLSFLLVYGIWIVGNYKAFPQILFFEASRAAWWSANWPSHTQEVIEFSQRYKDRWSAFLNWVKDNPKEYFILCIRRFKTILFWPCAEGVSLRHRLVSSFIFFTIYPLGYFGIIKAMSQKNKIALLILLFIISKIIVHTLLSLEGELRYRLPVEVFLIIFAAYILPLMTQKRSFR